MRIFAISVGSLKPEEWQVERTGEAYFEVAYNVKKPLKVLARGIEPGVLGSQFNINSYEDEAMIKTTLLEGKVKVTRIVMINK
jgi:ferric-dicitrate binding protein FerR (iron transport regulator)